MSAEETLREEQAHRHAWQVFEERNRAFRVLYDTVMEVQGAGSEETFSILCRNLLRISGGLCAALASFKPDTGTMVLESVCRRQDQGFVASGRPGDEVVVAREVVSGFKKNQVAGCRKHQGCLVEIFSESELSRFSADSEANCYRLSCVREGELIAAGMVQLPAGDELRLKDMIDTYLNLAGVIIQRVYLIRDLRFERSQFLSIFDSIEEIIYVTDPRTYEIIFTNQYLQKILGNDPRGGICYREFQGRDSPCEFCTNEIIMANKGDPYRWEYYNPTLEGHFLVTDRIIRWPDGRDVRFELASDITELKKTEERFKKAARVSTDLIYEWDVRDDSLEWFGDVAAALGYPPGEIPRTIAGWFELIHPEDRKSLSDSVERHRRKTEPICEEYRVRKNDGSWAYWNDMAMPVLDEAGRPVRWIGGCKDVTEKKRLEAEIIKARKLESVGILAGGIAHDFNNILTAILGNVSYARLDAEAGTELSDALVAAEKACRRAQSLTQQLLTFSSGGAPVTESVRLEDILRESAQFVLHGSNVSCRFRIADALWPVKADPGQVSQVINNLVLNADQAMPGGGKIELRAENCRLEEGEIPELEPGRYVRVEIEDNGVGIPSDQLAKIFDPYFSTKQKGSGLGLATVYSIIRKHNGAVRAESVLGRGSTFIVYLPASAKKAASAIDEDRVVGGSGRLLVMDDEEAVLEIAARMLKKLGYEVSTAADGAEAVEKYRQAYHEGRPFQAVILDLTVKGGKGGKEALSELKKIGPGVKAIVSSGYSTDPIMADYEKAGFSGVIPKPYQTAELSRVLARVVSDEAGSE